MSYSFDNMLMFIIFIYIISTGNHFIWKLILLYTEITPRVRVDVQNRVVITSAMVDDTMVLQCVAENKYGRNFANIVLNTQRKFHLTTAGASKNNYAYSMKWFPFNNVKANCSETSDNTMNTAVFFFSERTQDTPLISRIRSRPSTPRRAGDVRNDSPPNRVSLFHRNAWSKVWPPNMLKKSLIMLMLQ